MEDGGFLTAENGQVNGEINGLGSIRMDDEAMDANLAGINLYAN